MIGLRAIVAAALVLAGMFGAYTEHSSYDALARLQRPLDGFPGYNHSEHFYYDGVRRIQEVFNSIDVGSGSEESSEEETTTPTLATWAEREYIHTAGPGSYVDEYVCEVGDLNTSQSPLFHLQDANYNALGLVTAAGTVVRQHTFDAYGRLIHAEDFATTLSSRVGHQGLFFTRLDAPQGWPELAVTEVAPGVGGAAPLTLPVAGLYHTHNRSYAPGLGRWLQGDPNGTGAAVVAWDGWQGGRGPGTTTRLALVAPEPSQIYRDSRNRFAYMTDAPVAATDPLGLFEGAIGLLFGSTTASGLQSDWMQEVAQTGVGLKDSMSDFLFDYAFNQMMDLEWAGDWDSHDEDYSSNGITYTSINQMQAMAEAEAAGQDPSLVMGLGFKRFRSPLIEYYHIATRYGRHGREFRSLFKDSGLSINNMANLVPMLRSEHRRPGQRGHSLAYHDFILEQVRTVVDGARPNVDRMRNALINRLDELSYMIGRNPLMVNFP